MPPEALTLVEAESTTWSAALRTVAITDPGSLAPTAKPTVSPEPSPLGLNCGTVAGGTVTATSGRPVSTTTGPSSSSGPLSQPSVARRTQR